MTVAIDNNPYPGAVIDTEWEGSLRSARIVVPILMNLIHPNTVLDLGCAWGSWLKAFQENGVKMMQGVDGPWVDEERLLIARGTFRAVDLTKPFEIAGSFDLAVCLEVAEHLPEPVGHRLVQILTRAAPLVLFSAAVPGQGGYGHINEQWPAYWTSRFLEQGFRRLDPIRRYVWQNDHIQWWYRQNICLFASDAAILNSVALQAEEEYARARGVEWISKDILDDLLGRYEDQLARYQDLRIRHELLMTLRGMLKEFPGVASRAIKRRLPWQRHERQNSAGIPHGD